MAKWTDEEEDNMFDVLPTKDVVCEDTPAYLINEGTRCQGKFSGKVYPILILAAGMSIISMCIH